MIEYDEGIQAQNIQSFRFFFPSETQPKSKREFDTVADSNTTSMGSKPTCTFERTMQVTWM